MNVIFVKRDLHSLATWFDINKFTLEKIKPYECNDCKKRFPESASLVKQKMNSMFERKD